MMDFFADGGFQQLFDDLNEHYSGSEIWIDSSEISSYDYNDSNSGVEYPEENYLCCDQDYHLFVMEPAGHEASSNHFSEVSENQLQASLDYLLNVSYDLMEGNTELASLQNTTLTLQAKELSDWEEKFLDNFIEIPELIDFLPEKTPLCTDNCNHFLQECAENLKLFATPPSSPASCYSSNNSTPETANAKNDDDANSPSPDHSKENDKIYTCNFGDCGKIYAKPAHLKAHLRRHLGEKPYVCNWSDCTWRFSRSDELARHRRSHSGIKPYKCDFCGKCFARSDHLTKHRKVHERRILAASKAGKIDLDGVMPQSVLTVRPGRKRKNQL
uniref:C2H2-type domain-containing protein n=1 Tax=Musca domestica TaxID=7370 RepID=A0A1I8M534_MUSDO